MTVGDVEGAVGRAGARLVAVADRLAVGDGGHGGREENVSDGDTLVNVAVGVVDVVELGVAVGESGVNRDEEGEGLPLGDEDELLLSDGEMLADALDAPVPPDEGPDEPVEVGVTRMLLPTLLPGVRQGVGDPAATPVSSAYPATENDDAAATPQIRAPHRVRRSIHCSLSPGPWH